MPQITSKRRRSAAAAALLLLLVSLALAACGGSSTSSSTNASATAATTGTSTNAAGPLGGRFKALRECLQKSGITLPQRTPGQRPRSGGGGSLGGGGGPQLPQGVTRTRYEAALKKCGATRGFFGAGRRLSNPSFTKALAKFAACMRQSGVNLPEPNTSGNGPVFNTKGLNTASAQFRSAETKCRSNLQGAFGTGAGGAPPAVGSPLAGAPGG
jgi:hypothetical protein